MSASEDERRPLLGGHGLNDAVITYVSNWARNNTTISTPLFGGYGLNHAVVSYVSNWSRSNSTIADTKDFVIPCKVGGDKETEERAPFLSIFKYSSTPEKTLLAVATVVAAASGAAMPAFLIIYGAMLDRLIHFGKETSRWNCTSKYTQKCEEITNHFMAETMMLCMWIASIGVYYMICNYLSVITFSSVAANQGFKIRCKFMAAVLRQDMAWYDRNKTGDFSHKMSRHLEKIQDGIGDKVGICASSISTTFLCVVCGSYYGWKLALATLAVISVPCSIMAILSQKQATVVKEEIQAYNTAGSVAEEVLTAIKTVVAFGGERKEIERYERCLLPVRKKGIKRGLITAIGAALFWLTMFVGNALGFWYGIRLILQDWEQEKPVYTGGTIVNIFFNIITAAIHCSHTAAYFESFGRAKGSASKVFDIIDREPIIDSGSDSGRKPSLSGKVTLRAVHFSYPTKPNVPVLAGVNLTVQPGETVALIGDTSCGKSTIMQLILRFYDAASGTVALDGNNVKDLNVGWLRDNIGFVGKEPVLFSATIEENIKLGKPGASQEEVENAAKLANIHDFIDSLPLKYKTLVGDHGTQLDGSQKQRIAIARAIIKSPKVLLLDEATYGMDTAEETVVQAALEEASLGRAAIVIPHRLSTIRNANKIVVLADGSIQEVGTHNELMNRRGIYYRLVLAQIKEADEEDDSDDSVEITTVRKMHLRTPSTGVSISSEYLTHEQDHKGLLEKVEEIGDEEFCDLEKDMDVKSQLTGAIGTGVGTSAEGLAHGISGRGLLAELEDEGEDKSAPSKIRLLKLCAKEWPYIAIGSISSIIMGIYFLLSGVLFGEIFGLLKEDKDEIAKKYTFFCLIFVIMAVTSFVFNFLQVFMFTIAGEKLTFRLRKSVFSQIITQDIAFFDIPKNSVRSLCSRLTLDASDVQRAALSRISMVLQSISTFIVSIAFGFWLNYKLGSVVLAFVPLILLASYFESRIFNGQMKSGAETANKIAVESIENIRTVAALHQEATFYNKFSVALSGPHKRSRSKSHFRGVIYGFAQSIRMFAYAAVLFYGTRLLATRELTYAELLILLEGVIVGVMTVGQSVSLAPKYQIAKVAAVRIFKLLDMTPKIDPFSEEGKILDTVKGDITFQKVRFNYPSRHDVKILKGLSLEIESGKTVALVGRKGCGKSTCVQLMERLYDPDSGKVMLDGVDLREMNVTNLRSHLGLVSPVPVFFSYTIAENIAYGDNSRTPDINEVVAAARQANIHNFIVSLPEGYDTLVGREGTPLGDGEKQRVAIARALLRNPKILLLDETTSTLDAENEKLVQDALDSARSGRTCVIISQNLTTIQNADTILVMRNGRVVEKGTHRELLSQKGHYYNFLLTQI